MSSRTESAPEPVLLILADISGYTRYMTANAKTLAHSQGIITELIQAIVHQIKLPLEVAKLEGDAVFLFCPKRGDFSWPETRRTVGASLLAFFQLFRERLAELSESNTCSCQACAHIEKLRLKIIVHSGEVLFHRVLNFVELAGVDVIIAHRLLKNSVKAEQYLLVTEAARADLEFPGEISFVAHSETYQDLGRINAHVSFPEGAPGMAAEGSSGSRFQESWRLYRQLWFAPFTSGKATFRNLAAGTGAVGKFGYAAVMILLAPVFLPVGAVVCWFHSRKRRGHEHEADCHEQKPDGSCCRKIK